MASPSLNHWLPVLALLFKDANPGAQKLVASVVLIEGLAGTTLILTALVTLTAHLLASIKLKTISVVPDEIPFNTPLTPIVAMVAFFDFQV